MLSFQQGKAVSVLSLKPLLASQHTNPCSAPNLQLQNEVLLKMFTFKVPFHKYMKVLYKH